MRTFEIPAIGGIQLAPETEEHALFFEADEEIFFYRQKNDCHEKIIHLLSLSEDQINKFRNQARQRCILSGYSYKDRARQVLNVMNNMLNG
jgi:spore maturation protein CgeB